MSLSATVPSFSFRGSLLCAPKEVEGIFFRNDRTMSKLVKRLQNGTDFEVCVFETKKKWLRRHHLGQRCQGTSDGLSAPDPGRGGFQSRRTQ